MDYCLDSFLAHLECILSKNTLYNIAACQQILKERLIYVDRIDSLVATLEQIESRFQCTAIKEYEAVVIVKGCLYIAPCIISCGDEDLGI
jgi:hypothetical protein